MLSHPAKRDRVLDAIEESIRETLQANDEYLAAWDEVWKERVAERFAELSNSTDLHVAIYTPSAAVRTFEA